MLHGFIFTFFRKTKSPKEKSQVFASSVSKFSHCVHMCVCILRFQSVLASVCVDSNYCALVLSSMFYERKLNSVFCVHLLTFWINGWKFRNSLPISKSLRCGSTQVVTTTQMQDWFWGVEKCSKTLPRQRASSVLEDLV